MFREIKVFLSVGHGTSCVILYLAKAHELMGLRPERLAVLDESVTLLDPILPVRIKTRVIVYYQS
jgi:hypothetical protein